MSGLYYMTLKGELLPVETFDEKDQRWHRVTSFRERSTTCGSGLHKCCPHEFGAVGFIPVRGTRREKTIGQFRLAKDLLYHARRAQPVAPIRPPAVVQGELPVAMGADPDRIAAQVGADSQGSRLRVGLENEEVGSGVGI